MQSSRSSAFLPFVVPALAVVLCGHAWAQPAPQGQIDPTTLVSAPHGTFGGVPYTRYEAMFQGTTPKNRPFRVPCQIIAPANPAQGAGVLLFDWLVASTIPTLVGQEQADARYTLTDAFLFGRGVSYATVRCDPLCIGRQSPVSNPVRPWSDGLLNTTSEFIASAGDEFDIVVMYQYALRTDPIALQILGPIQRRVAFGYSASGFRLRGLLRRQAGVGLFDFSMVGGTGSGMSNPTGNGVEFVARERDPLPGAGLEIDFQSETDVLVFDGHKTRRESPNYRVYQFAGASHIRDTDVAEFGLPDPQTANSADWVPFFRALFVAGLDWCNGIAPPPSLWLGAPNSPQILRDANGNALVTRVGGQAVNTIAYRLPCVAIGENAYIPFAPAYDDGSFLGLLRALAGGRIDRTATFPSHATYVAQITQHAQGLQALRLLLPADANAIIQQATQSNIGN